MEKKVTVGIFSGLKVLDVASFIAAPAAAVVLSDFGADVIKVEPPGLGDPYRHMPSHPGMPASQHNYCWTMEARNKRSLALDLKQPEGRDVLCRLVRDTDVFITNFPPPVRERLGVSYPQIEPLNPRLIYASLSGYGETGEEANKPGFDSTAWWARSGMMDQVLPYPGSVPARSLPGMGDHPSALALFGAIVMALYRRERTGRGCAVGSSLLANGAWANAINVQAALCGATFFERAPREQPINALRNHYRCRDGRWFILSLLQEEKLWPRFIARVGRPELADDARFTTLRAQRQNAEVLTAILDAAFAQRDSAEWQQILAIEGMTVGPVNRIDDVAEDPQMLAADVLTPMQGEEHLTVNSPLWVVGQPKTKPRRAPHVGEHTDEVLAEHGFAPAEIEALRKSGTIG
jgi:crotonobetainyl-CoA:carnitine CoA-transferase CaiB-like acyl-CoA transferase